VWVVLSITISITIAKPRRDISMLKIPHQCVRRVLKAHIGGYGLIKRLNETRPGTADLALSQNFLDEVHDVPITANTFTLYTKHYDKSWEPSHLIILGLGYQGLL
jgi:hypothetical protein